MQDYLKLGAAFLTTTASHRQACAVDALCSIEKSNKDNIFDEKVAAVDIYRSGDRSPLLDVWLANYKWEEIRKPLRKSMEAQKDLIQYLNHHLCNWIFYCEDDVVIRELPTRKQLEWMISQKFGNRKVGMISFMHGGFSRNEHDKEKHTKWLREASNYRDVESSTSCLWLRSDDLRDAHFFEFPVTIVRTDLFLQCNKLATEKYKGVHSETALTNAWFDLGFDKEFCKVSWIKRPHDISTLSYEDMDNYILQHLLHLEAFGNSSRLRQVAPTYGVGMTF